MRRTFAPVSRKKSIRHKGFAHHIGETEQQETEQPGQQVSTPRQVAQARWQQVADNSPRVAQLKAYQEMSNKAQVIQRYEQHENGYLVSEGNNAVLKEDGSKELYLTPQALQDANTSLAGKNITNVRLQTGEPLEYGNGQYNKAIPKFTNPQTKHESQTVRKPKLQNDELARSIYKNFKLQQANIKTVLPILQNVHDMIKGDADRNEILVIIKTKQFMDTVGRDIGQRMLLYCHNEQGPEYTKEAVLAAVAKKIRGLEAEMLAYKNDDPYLPTGCGYLKNYLVGNTGGKQVGKNGNQETIGNFYGIDHFNDDSPEEAPWNNHYAAIIYKDGDDTVTLEDAAGQGMDVEKTHWIFNMYGTEQEKTFTSKTMKEYNRRKQQQEGMKRHGYTEDQRLGSF